MNTKHTPKPWELRKHNGTNLYGAKGQNNDWFVFENALEKDAARIVACVNACAGIHDPQELITGADIALKENRELKAQRDELLNAIKAVRILQKEYFKSRDPRVLASAKQAEANLDKLINTRS